MPDAAGTPGLTPPSRADLAPLVDAVREAAAARRRLQPRGAGTWWPELAPGVAPLCGAPAGLLRFDPPDLVATAGAATPLADLHRELAARGTWVALDAPGGPHRTLGGALASGGAGPLAASAGPPRDQVLGLTFVAGNGLVAKSGGRVVKNVAGFDLAKILVGSAGGFGCIADVHLRLRALPPSDRTAAWSGGGSLRDVAAAGARMLAAGCTPAALEAVDPALAARLGLSPEWTLLVRAFGSAEGAAEELAAGAAAAGRGAWRDIADGAAAWRAWGPAVGAARVVLRIGADPARWADAAMLAAAHLGGGAAQLVSATIPRGTVRVGLPETDATRIAALRAAAAEQGWPVTLERADAALRGAAGVWGALPPRTLRLATALKAAFDPNGVFDAPRFA